MNKKPVVVLPINLGRSSRRRGDSGGRSNLNYCRLVAVNSFVSMCERLHLRTCCCLPLPYFSSASLAPQTRNESLFFILTECFASGVPNACQFGC